MSTPEITPVSKSLTIDGKTYLLGALRCKQLKAISRLLATRRAAGRSASVWDDIDQFTPFIVDSVKYGGSEGCDKFTAEQVDELTMTQFVAAWQDVVKLSGIQIVNVGPDKKPGEPIPTESTGPSSTQGLQVPSDGVTA